MLAAAAPGSFNMLHGCGAGVLLDEFLDYPVQAISWAQAPGNPSLPEGRRRTGRAVVCGLPAKPVIATLTTEVVAGHVHASVGATSSRGLLLGPDCSINPDTPEPLLHAARAARDASAAGGSARV